MPAKVSRESEETGRRESANESGECVLPRGGSHATDSGQVPAREGLAATIRHPRPATIRLIDMAATTTRTREFTTQAGNQPELEKLRRDVAVLKVQLACVMHRLRHLEGERQERLRA